MLKVKEIIKTDLNFKEFEKYNLHRLSLRHIAECRTRCINLYDNTLSGD